MRFLVLILLIVFAIGCNSSETLQHYFVEKSEDPDFLVTDFSLRNFNKEDAAVSAEAKQALEVFSKINVLIYKKRTENQGKYDLEQKNVQDLLKNKEYQELMHVTGKKSGGALYFVGKNLEATEFILYGYDEKSGFSIIRLLGEDMTFEKIFNALILLEKTDKSLNITAFKKLFEKQ